MTKESNSQLYHIAIFWLLLKQEYIFLYIKKDINILLIFFPLQSYTERLIKIQAQVSESSGNERTRMHMKKGTY